MGEGHVFVVRGAMEHVDCDVAIVSTDDAFSVTSRWARVLGVETDGTGHCLATGLKPDGWASRRYGRSKEPAAGVTPPLATWFVDAAWYEGQTPEQALSEMMDRLAGALRQVARAGVQAGHGRPRPLVALPTVGTGGGGFGPVRGRVIDALLGVCQEVVESTPLDVVIVAASSSDYSAIQARRRNRPRVESDLDPGLQRAAEDIARRVRQGGLALFIGAGASIPAGLPSWATLVERLSAEAGVSVEGLDGALDQAELLRRVLGDRFSATIARIIGRPERYAITHAMLASLGCAEVVTTNYDQLYELAAGDVVGEGRVHVLPFDPARDRGPWVLKMHGDTRHPGSIVLSRSDFVSYDQRARPMGSIVQSLMITKHLLVVGASMTDDNFLRLAHEVLSFQSGGAAGSGASEPIGTVVTLREEPAKTRLWEGRFNYVPASTAAKQISEQGRDLAIFLDLVAMLSSEATYILDPRYAVLLGSQDERQAAAAARSLLAQIAPLPGPWQDLAEHLRSLGARTG